MPEIFGGVAFRNLEFCQRSVKILQDFVSESSDQIDWLPQEASQL